jgi:hypothetical protein
VTFAAHLWGSPAVLRVTEICYDRAADNFNALAAALNELGATPRGESPVQPFVLDAQTLASDGTFIFNTTAGPLDCVGTPRGTRGYAELAEDARTFEVERVRVRAASLDDLMRMRRATDRPVDRIHLEILASLKNARRGNADAV